MLLSVFGDLWCGFSPELYTHCKMGYFKAAPLRMFDLATWSVMRPVT